MRTSSLYAVLIIVLTMTFALSQDANAQSEADAKKVKAICEKTAMAYALTSKTGTQFELVGQSRLQWSKNTYEDVYGNVFLWVDDDVPVAIASIFKFVRPKMDLDAEFHSLSTKPIRAKFGATNVWEPSKGGVSFRPLAGVVSPQSSLRLSQMRRHARSFRAERENANREVTRLRLLSTPIHSYSNKAKGILAGAIFTFVDQTDPELWLIIEARQSEEGVQSWSYAAARMNCDRLRLYRNSELVFTAETVEEFNDAKAPYTIFQDLEKELSLAK